MDRRHSQSHRRVAYHVLGGALDTRADTEPETRDDPAVIAHAIAGVVDRVAAQGGGPCLLPYHAWTALGEGRQDWLMLLARDRGVWLAVALPG